MFELFRAIGLGIMMLLPLVNPLTTVALFLSLSKNMTIKERNKQSRLTAIYVFIIMIVTFYAGTLVMSIFGISIPGLRIAGGLIVSFIGFSMLFPKHIEHNVKLDKDDISKVNNNKINNFAFVPLAMPTTAGPGTIAMIISWASTINQEAYFAHWIIILSPILVFLSIGFIVWIAIKSSGAIMRIVGVSGIETISRLMGFLLVCMGIQFVINGILEIILNYSK